MNKIAQWLRSKPVKIAGLSILSLLYISGVICLFFNLQLGVTLWGVALVPSIIIFIAQKRNERQAKLLEAERAAQEKQE